jgi:invasion protein IalB
MSSTLSRLLAAAVLAAFTAPALHAQESTPEPEAPAADAATDDGLSMGQQPADGVGTTYSKADFDQWQQRCVKTEDGNDPCQLYQLLKDGEGTSVAEISMFALPEGGQAAAGATIIVPLETLLTAGVRFAIDSAEPKVYPFTVCAQIGCIARIGFTADELAAIKKGTKGVLTIVPAVNPKATVTLDVSLKGFTAGFDAVNASNAALPKQE